MQLAVRGVVAAAFDHWDSRAGDPQLHTHVVVLNRVQTADDAWRTLDSRALFKAAVGLSELYNGLLSDHLTAALGWGWEATRRAHSDVPKYEVAGVPTGLREEFSQRSRDIEEHKNDLVQRFFDAHRRQPTNIEVLQLRQQSTLQTRPDKQLHSLTELIAGWRVRASEVLGSEVERLADSLRGRNELPLLRQGDLDPGMLAAAATVAVGTVSERCATFTWSNVFAEVLRQLHGARFASAVDRIAVAERVVELALQQVLTISPPELAQTPAQFRRPDGSSRFRPRDARIYTTRQLLDAETRLLDAGRATDGPCIPTEAMAASWPPISDARPRLASDQVAAVRQVATSGRVLDVLVGPAGFRRRSRELLSLCTRKLRQSLSIRSVCSVASSRLRAGGLTSPCLLASVIGGLSGGFWSQISRGASSQCFTSSAARGGSTISGWNNAQMPPPAPTVDPGSLAQWCLEHLGSPPADELFRSGYLSAVIGLRLVDGREVVVKVRPDSPRLAACVEVQRRLFQAGYPCPRPLTGVTPFGSDAATAEAYVPGGAVLPSVEHAPRAFAEAFAQLIQLAPRPAEVSTLDPAPSWAAWNHGGDGLWPYPDDREVDLNEVAGGEWIDDAGRRARDRLRAGGPDAVIGHCDWLAGNLRWSGDALVVVHDWDSVTADGEAVLVGFAAALYSTVSTDQLATVEDTERFLAAYCHARGRQFNTAELQRAWAAGVWTRAYDAKYQHAIGQPIAALSEDEALQRLSRTGTSPRKP